MNITQVCHHAAFAELNSAFSNMIVFLVQPDQTDDEEDNAEGRYFYDLQISYFECIKQ